MIIGLMVILFILAVVFLFVSDMCYNENVPLTIAGISFIAAIGILIFGCFHGFINYPPTEGMHQGIITAVDLEGVYFRKYKIYLKSNGYTPQGDESIYLLYDYETELAEELKSAIGKNVKLYYGHDGGYIGAKSCGTYHIKNFEIIEE